MIRQWILSLFSILFLGCSGNNASHLPSILELPGASIGTGVENVIYKSKRKKVSTYVASHIEALRSGDEATLTKAMAISKVPQKNHPFITKELNNAKSITLNPLLMISEMVTSRYASLYSIKQVDKKINGFTYEEVYTIIQTYVQRHPKSLYEAIKSRSSLDALMDQLHMNDVSKRADFSSYLHKNYHKFYVEPIVLLLMVHS